MKALQHGFRRPKWRARSWAVGGLIDDLPYVAIIVLGLIGISWTSLAQTSSTAYWVYVTPIIAVVCIIAGWRHAPSGERVAMVVIQVLQWVAVLIAMYLITTTNAQQSLEANATGLMLLTLLALGVDSGEQALSHHDIADIAISHHLSAVVDRPPSRIRSRN